MRRFLLRRALHTGVVVVAVVTLVFGLFRLVPGDPFLANDERQATEQEHAQFRARWGYDQSLPQQYLRWVVNFASGDFGWSHAASRPVREVLGRAVANTAVLMIPALIIGWFSAIVIGTWSAVRSGTARARAWDAATLAIVSIPDFLVAQAVLAVFAVGLHLAPAGGMVDVVFHDTMSPLQQLADIAAHLVLPATTLAVVVAITVSRYHRASVLSVLHEDYVRTARAKGVTERDVILRHVVPNALGPAIAIAGILLPSALAGAVFVEKIFAWPGMGRTLVDAVLGRDYEMVQAILVVGTILVALGGMLADVAAAMLNPRLRLES